MAVVYLAEDQVLMRKVAVKRLDADSPGDATRRFVREAKIGAASTTRTWSRSSTRYPAGATC